MDYTKLGLFILYIILEATIIPSYLNTYLNATSNWLYGSVLVSLWLRMSFKKFSILFSLFFILFDLIVGLYLIKIFYDPDLSFINFTHIYVLHFIVFIMFYFTKNEQFKELKNSAVGNYILTFVVNCSVLCFFFGYIKGTHLNDALNLNINELNINDLKKIGLEFLVDVFVMGNQLVLVLATKYYYSKSKKTHFLNGMIRRIFTILLITIAFYANYNSQICTFVYEKFNEHVPQPHNIILYNSFLMDRDLRFRIFLATLIYI